MRKLLSVLFVLMLSCSLMAQVRTGNILGKVVDTDGNLLPGVAVTLSGTLTAAMNTITSAEGIFRFISLAPAKDYILKAELQGFKTTIRKDIIVVVGANVELTLIMEIGTLSEEIIVTAQNPVIDTKKTTIGATVTNDILQGLPTARDPWVILQMAPSIVVGSENIGGSTSGQSSATVGRGSSHERNVWNMDGISLNDPAAVGSNLPYFDFDVFEEMTITTGGGDITMQTGGVGVNIVTKRGGNKLTFGGRFYLTDNRFQANNFTAKLKAEGLVGINQINEIKDYGFYLGGPLLKDKAWFWGSWGVQDIQTLTVFGAKDDTLLSTFTGKLNLQIFPQNRLELFAFGNKKYKYGRGPSTSNPLGTIQRPLYHFGFPTVKIQDEHMFGKNLFASFKYGYSNGAFELISVMDPDFKNISIWDMKDQRWYSSTGRNWNQRPINTFSFLTNYFIDNLLGTSHDLKVGLEYQNRSSVAISGNPGNITIRRNYVSPTVDFNGDGFPDIPQSPNFMRFEFQRESSAARGITALSGYLSDTISFGRFNLIVGLRYDKQTPLSQAFTRKAVDNNPVWGTNVTSQTKDFLDRRLPGIAVPEVKAKAADGSAYNWTVFSPRFGLTWDVTGDGKTLAKLSFAKYGDYMGTDEAGRWTPSGSDGFLQFWWMDNGDGIVDYRELFWHKLANYSPYRVFDDAGSFIGNWEDAAGTFWGSYDYKNPGKLGLVPYESIDSNAGSARTLEYLLTLERELFADFAVVINAQYRRYDNYNWALKYFPVTGVFANQDWYKSAGNLPANIPGLGDTKDAKNHAWYYTTTEGTDYSPWTWVKKRPDFYHDYYGVDFIFRKRLSKGWMVDGNFTWQKEAVHYGNKGYLDPTNIWALEGKEYQPYQGYGGQIFSRWLLKVGGLYQLPYDIDLGFTLLGREGWVIVETVAIVDYTLPNPKSRSATLFMTPRGTERLPTFFNLSLRVEKMLRISDIGKIYVMADVFNVFNTAAATARNDRFQGTFYKYADSSLNQYVPYPNTYKLNSILNPRIARFGLRFTF